MRTFSLLSLIKAAPGISVMAFLLRIRVVRLGRFDTDSGIAVRTGLALRARKLRLVRPNRAGSIPPEVDSILEVRVSPWRTSSRRLDFLAVDTSSHMANEPTGWRFKEFEASSKLIFRENLQAHCFDSLLYPVRVGS